MTPSLFEQMATAVVVVDAALSVTELNAAAEAALGLSAKQAAGQKLTAIVLDPAPLEQAVAAARAAGASLIEHELPMATVHNRALIAGCVLTPIEGAAMLLEFRPVDTQLRISREAQLQQQQQANRELLRNLAHEIKNPLGGLRGAAQLLEGELDAPSLKEYTRIIIQEADRLRSLMDRLLAPNRVPKFHSGNIHQVLERVRALILAECGQGIDLRRDYDASLPECELDEEQMIQVVLNIARNAAQAMKGHGELVFRTRAARQVVLARRRHRLALEIQIIDNGPGIPADLIDEIFYPLVSRREGGSGLGLTIAETFVHQHQGAIQCESRPGRTCFSILLPLRHA